jgi:ABC-type nitrate/sulfonate/bicarbonate transport system permease component
MGIRIRGPLPADSSEKFLEAFSDTHVAGLVEHCVEVLVWRRTVMGFAAGAIAGFLLGYLLH